MSSILDFDGSNPQGSLIQATDGKLYGMSRSGGSSNAGVIFSYNPSNAAHAKLHEFNVADGAEPWGSLFQASNGQLYGMTYRGGNHGYGVVFPTIQPARVLIRSRQILHPIMAHFLFIPTL